MDIPSPLTVIRIGFLLGIGIATSFVGAVFGVILLLGVYSGIRNDRHVYAEAVESAEAVAGLRVDAIRSRAVDDEVEVFGELHNGGAATVADVKLQVEFLDATGMLVDECVLPAAGRIEPGGTEAFMLRWGGYLRPVAPHASFTIAVAEADRER